MPGAEIVAVKATSRWAGVGAEVFEVGRSLRRFVIVIARCWPCALPMPPPTHTVAFDKLLRRACGVSVIAGSEDRTGNLVQQFRGCLRCVSVTAGNIAG